MGAVRFYCTVFKLGKDLFFPVKQERGSKQHRFVGMIPVVQQCGVSGRDTIGERDELGRHKNR